MTRSRRGGLCSTRTAVGGPVVPARKPLARAGAPGMSCGRAERATRPNDAERHSDRSAHLSDRSPSCVAGGGREFPHRRPAGSAQSKVSNGVHEGMSARVERRPPAGSSIVVDERHPAVDHVVLLDTDRPPRRRRSALLGGGLLIAASPVAVGAGVFVPGFAALGLGALLLLLPPTDRRERRRTPLRFVRAAPAYIGHAAAALSRPIARFPARVFRAAARFVATAVRDGVVLIGRATAAGVVATGAAAARAGSRSWSAARVGAPRA